MKHYIVQSGLTRRLVESETPRTARVTFLRNVPRGIFFSVDPNALIITEATDAEIEGFAKKRKAKFDDQLALGLDDVRATRGKRTKAPKKKGGHA